MTSYKLYKPLFLSLSLALAGCGSDSDSDSDDGGETPEGTLTVANPIADFTLVADTSLDFSIPADTCAHTGGAAINYSITNVSGSAGFTLVNFNQLTGKPDALGDVDVTVTCSVDEQSLTDEFTITIEDFEAAPTVQIPSLGFPKSGDVVELEGWVSDKNLSGSIVSYLWEQTSGPDVTLTDADKVDASFTAPEVFEETTFSFKLTVTDNAGLTASDTIEVNITSPSSPDVSLSFPLVLGDYNEDSIDMFGNVEAATDDTIASVTVTIDDVEEEAVVTGNTWRVQNVTLTETTDINIKAVTTAGYINNETVTVNYNTLYETTIDKNVTDIAVDESRGKIYVQVAANGGDSVTENKISEFSINSNSSEYLEVSQATNFDYKTSIPTGLTLDTDSRDLLVSYIKAVTKIDLSTNRQTVISDVDTGNGTEPGFITDISYSEADELIYAADAVSKEIYTIDPSTGHRETFTFDSPVLDDRSFLSVLVNSEADTLYFSLNTSLDSSNGVGYADTATGTLQGVPTSTGPVSDFALNEAGNELFYVDATNDLIKVDLTDNTTSVFIADLFAVEGISNEASPMIGLHYHSERNVLFAVGKDADGTNKLLVIDPVSGDYAKVATGTVD